MKRFLLLLPLLLSAAPAHAEKWLECTAHVFADRGGISNKFQISISPAEDTAQVITEENQYISKINFFPGLITVGPMRIGNCDSGSLKEKAGCITSYYDAYFKINRKSLSYDYKDLMQGLSSEAWFGGPSNKVERWTEDIGSCKIIPSPVKENQI